MSEFLVIKIYSFGFNIFMSNSPKSLWTTQGTIWVVRWATQDFWLAAGLTGACMMWCQRVTQICDCNNNVSVPWTGRLLRNAWLQSCISWHKCHWCNYCDDEFSISNQITSVGIYIFVKSYEIDYFANAFPYKYKTQHYQQRQVWHRNASLGRDADRCAQTEFMEDIGWSHGTVSMAMHCLRFNKLTPDGSLANHVFDAAAAVTVFYTGSEAFFSWFATPHTCAPIGTIPVETLPMTNKYNTQAIGFRTTAQVIIRRSNDV